MLVFKMMAMALLVTTTALANPPSVYTLWVEGDPPDFEALATWITGGGDAHLPTGGVVLRVIDPHGVNGCAYQFPDDTSDPSCVAPVKGSVFEFVKNLRETYEGPISVLPYYPSTGWNWVPADDPACPQWARPLQWAIQANTYLASLGVNNGFFAVNFENFGSNSYIQIDDTMLLSWQQYMLGLWPTWNQDPNFIGLIISKDNHSALNVLRWTTTTRGPYPLWEENYYSHPPLVGGMLECYEIYKENCSSSTSGAHYTVVDVTDQAYDPPFYPPFSGPQIYEAAAAEANPAQALLGTPTADCPDRDSTPPEPSTMGFMITVNAPKCDGPPTLPTCMSQQDLSTITFLFSNSSSGEGGKVFGLWDGVQTPATVDDFKQFIGLFDSSFQSYWQIADGQMPAYGVFDFEHMPASWTTATCPTDLNGDQTTQIKDLLLMIHFWGSPAGDCDGDGDGDVDDLLAIVDAFNTTCP